MRTIDADALIEKANKEKPIGRFTLVEYLKNAPTVEPEITEKQAILLLINNGWLVNHDKELRGKWERPQGDNKEALFVLNHLFYDCDNMTQKEYDILLEAIKEADNEHV